MLPHYERKMDFFGSWSEDNFANWGIQANARFDGVSLPNVAWEENQNLSSAQKELLLWHWKLGISMHHIQESMKVSEMKEPNGRIRTMDRVIVPKYVKLQLPVRFPSANHVSCREPNSKSLRW